MADSPYHALLLDHYRNPRHRGDIEPAMQTQDGINANCGDRIKLGLHLDETRIREVRYQIRACAVCTASASIMGELIEQRPLVEARALIQQLKSALKEGRPWPDRTEALSGLTGHVNRHACVLLPWEACETLLMTQPGP